MVSTLTVAEEIVALKRQRRAVILAHYYQDPEIQEVADSVGDGFALACAGARFKAEVIVFCGVRPMAEMAKVVSPGRMVLMPDAQAGCSLVDSCPVEGVRAWRRRYPDSVVVSHMNTSVEVKAESDFLCTSRNAAAVVNSIPAARPILFLPDSNLGRYVQQQTGRKNMKIWQGACIVHATFPARRLASLRAAHPHARVAAHPECPGDVLRRADFVGSTSEIVDWCSSQAADEFILATESGVRYSIERLAPGKKFYFVANESCNCSECPYMRRNSLEKVLACLEALQPRIELGEEIVRRARVPLERMLAVA